jgi:hypothetical protein
MALGIASGSGVVALVSPIPWKAEEKESRTSGRSRLEAVTWQCKACDKQTSVTAGTVMHRSKIPLRNWFLAAHLVVTHSNGISAMQLWPAVGLNSYKDAWLLLQKIRRAMVNPGRDPLTGTVEVDETSLPFRRSTDPIAGGQG